LLQQEALEQRTCQLNGSLGHLSLSGFQTHTSASPASRPGPHGATVAEFIRGTLRSSAKDGMGGVASFFGGQPVSGARLETARSSVDARFRRAHHLFGTVHTAIQQTNATLAPHMCIFSGHAPRSRRSMELPHGQRPALKTHAAASHLTSPCLSGSSVHAPAIIRRPHHAVSTARMSLAARANAAGCGACAAARKSWPTRANAAGCRPCQMRACP
jgi:hypothetical protein